MTNRPSPALPKWPFILADAGLLLASAWVINKALAEKAYLIVAVGIVAWMFGAWVCVLPWLKEFQAESKLAESDNLTSALEQIQKLEEVGDRVQAASGMWQSAQDAAMRVTAAAKEVEEKIRADSKDFMEFAERINNDEKQHLRLEVEKLRRNEGEWLQVAARMLDHTFAITTAATRSGQPNLANQMTNFQSACRDAARRVGLIPFHPNVGDPFEDRSQQLEDANAKPEEGSVVSDILATGYTFQGQLLRKALVRLSKPQQPETTQPDSQFVAEPQPTETPVEQPPEAVEEQVAVAEQAEESHPQTESPKESTDQWARMEDSFQRQTEPTSERAPAPAEEPASTLDEERNPPEPVVEVAAAESTPEQPGLVEEEKPRRRQRKPDPQSSLPF